MRMSPAVSCLFMLLMVSSTAAFSHGKQVVAHRVAALEVRGELPPAPTGVTNLKFGEFFRMPVGPLGLEPTDKLLSLNGQRVRLVGYMVREEEPTAGHFILSPLPVNLGDEDESLADDLPPSTVSIQLPGGTQRKVPYIAGLIKLTGILEVGAKEEADGRVSSVRLLLELRTANQILGAKPVLRASAK